MGLSADAQRENGGAFGELLCGSGVAASSPSCSVGPDCLATYQQLALVQTRFSEEEHNDGSPEKEGAGTVRV